MGIAVVRTETVRYNMLYLHASAVPRSCDPDLCLGTDRGGGRRGSSRAPALRLREEVAERQAAEQMDGGAQLRSGAALQCCFLPLLPLR